MPYARPIWVFIIAVFFVLFTLILYLQKEYVTHVYQHIDLCSVLSFLFGFTREILRLDAWVSIVIIVQMFPVCCIVPYYDIKAKMGFLDIKL